MVRRNSFRGKRVVLTGASSGIGWYVATQLVQQGAYVVCTARRADRLKQLRLATGNPLKRLIAIPGDITDEAHR
ncbi:MAG: SDR family NAD(P)-dependent oxidoreductase, partial [Planctomycetota bacterium]